MRNLFKNDLTILVELLSALSFLAMGFSLQVSETMVDNMKNAHFWMTIFFIISSLQILGIKLKFDLSILRICMAWVAGSLWCTLFLQSLNSVLSVPILAIGLFNIYAFVALSKKATFNWQKFFNKT